MGWGEFFALASPMGWALAVIMFRRSGETMPAFELNLSKNALALALMVPTVLVLDGWSSPAFSRLDWAVMLVSGVLGMAVGDTLYFRALRLLGASRTGVVGSLLSPFVILLSALLLGERLVSAQWAGFAMVMGGILFVTWRRERSEISARDLRLGAVLGAVAMFSMALGVVMVKPLLEVHPFSWVVSARLLGGLGGMLVVTTLRGRWGVLLDTYRKPHPWVVTVTGCFLGGYLAMMLWLAGYRLIPASEASIYNEAQGSFIVLFAWLFLGESMQARKLAGLALTLAGVLTMLLSR